MADPEPRALGSDGWFLLEAGSVQGLHAASQEWLQP